jgi:PAS domain S-box-containing protein
VIFSWSEVDDVHDVTPALYPAEQIGRILSPIVYGGIAALLIVMVTAWRVAQPIELAALGAEALALFGALRPISRGRFRVAAWLMVLAIIVGSGTVVLSFGSLRTVGSFGFVFSVIIAAVFLPRRDIVASLVIVCMAVAALTWFEVTRTVPVPIRPFGWPHAVMMAVGLLFVTAVVGYARIVGVAAVQRQNAELRERKRTEERLRLSMEATRQGWFDLDLDTGQVVASEQFARLMGAPAPSVNDAVGTMSRDSWIAAIHLEDRPAVLQRFERCLRLGDTEQMDYRLLGLDGSFRWIRSTAKVVQRDEAGRPLRMTGTHVDITDQMATTLALAASERSYRALVEMSPVGVMVLRDAHVRYVNPAAVALLGGANADALLGANLRHFLPASSGPQLDAICRAAVGGGLGAPDSAELVLQRTGGDTFEASIRCTEVVFEGEASLQFSFTDISARKSAEEARLRSRQLEALGTLAGGIAHDFNNILMAIRGNSELVANEPGLSHAGVDQMREILVAGQRASELVRRITTFARPKEQRHDRVLLPDLLQEVLRLLRPTVPAGISLEVKTVQDVPPILADASQVHEAIVNLTTNAVYAIGSSRVGRVSYIVDRVELVGEAARSASVTDGRYARLVVHDTGAGMNADTQRRIFDVFYTTKPVGEGSGLGLSMVYGTMRSHGGAISVESQPDHGASFQLLFPVFDGPAPLHEPETLAVVAAMRPLRVLFVDDEPQLVRLAQRTLEPLGHAVTSFTDPIAALEHFRDSPDAFDVVVTDLSMPNMSGIDFTRALRCERADVPIVMVTGYADDADEAEALAAGVTRLAVKAADPHQLSGLLAEVAARR